MRYICTSIVTTLALVGTSFAATINVPGDHATIQAAVDAAVDGDEVLVFPGTYFEQISFLGKTIAVRSVDGPDVTILDGEGKNGSVVTVPAGSEVGTAIEGFAIQNGFHSSGGRGGGIHIETDASMRVGYCHIINCHSQHGGGINAQAAEGNHQSLHLHDTAITDCNATHQGGLCLIYGSPEGQTVIERCIFTGGTSWNEASCISGWNNSPENPVVISDCVFNDGSGVAFGLLRVQRGFASITGCVFTNGQAGGSGGMAGDALAVGMYSSNAASVDVRNCVFLDNGAPVAALHSAHTAEMHDSVFCNNVAPNLAGPWQIENVLELNGCPEDLDCNEDGVVDWIQCVTHPDSDLDGDWIPDECQMIDCNANGVNDADDIAGGSSQDCNANGIPDECDIADGSALDCNSNGIPDSCDLSDETSQDVDDSGVPDECECLSDIDTSGEVDISDVLTVIAQWGNAGPLGDANYDGIVDTNDILLVLSAWGPCP